MFPHRPRGVRLDNCLDARIFQRAFRQVRLGAAGVRLDDNELAVIHNPIICPRLPKRLFADGRFG